MLSFDLSMLRAIHDLFWHRPFYIVLYASCLLSLLAFRRQMRKGCRVFLPYSLICLVLFIYNPVFLNLADTVFLKGDRVTVRLFLLLPLVFTEAYVFTSLVRWLGEKNRFLGAALIAAIALVLGCFGITPWQRAEKGWGIDMYLPSENLYKIPQEHLDICDSILADMDGERAVLSMYQIDGINNIGGTLNYSIRMYTSRLQLNSVESMDAYLGRDEASRTAYWEEYMNAVRSLGTDNSNYYFLFPTGDARAEDLLMRYDNYFVYWSENYQVIAIPLL